MIDGPPQRLLTENSQSSLRGKMLVLELLGTLSLRNETPPVPVSAQQKRSLGLLAILALAGRQGFHFTDSREFESWIESERARLRREYQTAVEFLANAAAEAGEHSRSVTWWRRLANSDPLSAGATQKLMLALSAAGDRAGAVQYARVYQELVRQELEMEPDSEIEDLVAALSRPATTATTATVDLAVTPHP